MATATKIELASIATPSTDTLKAIAIGGAVEGSPDGQTFLKPIEIVLPYADALVPAGTDAAIAKILMAPKGSTSFTALDSTVDKATHTLHATTMHFTTFVPTVPTAPAGALVLNEVIPSTIVYAGGQGGNSSVRIKGSNFPEHATVLWDGTAENVTFWGLSSTEANISLFNVTTLGTHTLRIKTATETSNQLEVTVAPPPGPPTLTSITPTTTPATVSEVPLRVVGTGFTSGSKVNSYPTTFVSSTVLDAVIPPDSLNYGTGVAITVFTPAPGGGTSNAIKLAIQGGSPGTGDPVLSGMKPQTISPGSAAFTLKVSTLNTAAANSQIVFGSTALATTLSDDGIGRTIATATVPASLITKAGRVGVALLDAVKGPSNLLAFDVIGGLPCSATNVDLDGDSGNGCETDISSGPVCVTLRRGGFYGQCYLFRTLEHPSFAKKDAGIFTNSAGMNQATGANSTELPVLVQQGSTSVYVANTASAAGSQLDLSTGQLNFSAGRGGTQVPADTCPLGWPPLVLVKCAGNVTLVPLADLAK